MFKGLRVVDGDVGDSTSMLSLCKSLDSSSGISILVMLPLRMPLCARSLMFSLVRIPGGEDSVPLPNNPCSSDDTGAWGAADVDVTLEELTDAEDNGNDDESETEDEDEDEGPDSDSNAESLCKSSTFSVLVVSPFWFVQLSELGCCLLSLKPT